VEKKKKRACDWQNRKECFAWVVNRTNESKPNDGGSLRNRLKGMGPRGHRPEKLPNVR